MPLGGYVRMLDEREGPVDPAERHLAFNTQPLRKRAAIVAAGPAANLLLAVLLYAAVNWAGVQGAADRCFRGLSPARWPKRRVCRAANASSALPWPKRTPARSAPSRICGGA